ncbi:MAG TPA: APC family permease [Candidatus Acidoferrales bacterium]|nr:APC family permease [Candidatus Acidoferrales bacterium]
MSLDSSPATADPKKQLRRVLGFWDVLLFNIVTVLGPRWLAAAGHNGTSSISLWVLAALLFFVPSAFVINELSSRYPNEGGLYAWSKEAFGDFHGFVAGWTYWIYTVFYFPGLLLASASMAAYIGGAGHAELATNREFLLIGCFVLLFIAVFFNLIGVNIGKWLQNAGGVGTYLPLLMLVGISAWIWHIHGSLTHFTWKNMMPMWNQATVNFWPQMVFGFAGFELVATMSEEVRDPQRTLPRAVWGAGAAVTFMYIVGTVAVLGLIPAQQVDPLSGVFQAITAGSTILKIGFFGVLAAVLVTIGNAGGVGSTVAGIARVPFVAGIDRYLPKAFGKVHPRWRTPYVAILVQAILSGAILLLAQISETMQSSYQVLVSICDVLYFIPFLYMYAAAIRLAYRKDRSANPRAVLIPGGKVGVWIAAMMGFSVILLGIVLSFIPPGDSANKVLFVSKLVVGTAVTILLGLMLYWRGAREKSKTASIS